MKTLKNVSLDKIYLWQDNPRVESAKSQGEAFENIYNFSNKNRNLSQRQLINLAQSIAENGYQNEIEPILVLEQDKDKYIVQDANRRMSVLKMLNNPNEYKTVLAEKDFEKVQQLTASYAQNIVNEVDIVAFEDTEEDKNKLQEILARKHNGPQDGVGTSPWSKEAKDRFTRKQTLASKIETQFEEQFAETLSSYIGGAHSKTSTERVFNSKPVKEYLDIQDAENLTDKELDKIKRVADETKAYVDRENTYVSRINTDAIKNDIIIPLVEADENKEQVPTVSRSQVKKSFKDFDKLTQSEIDRALGGKYLDASSLLLDDKNFMSVNQLLSALSNHGTLQGEEQERRSKALILSPSVRVIYELTRDALRDADIIENLTTKSSPKEDVRTIHNALKENGFITFLSDNGIISTSYKETKNLIDSTNFAAKVDQSNLTAHKGLKHFGVDELREMFNFAVLFAMLSQQYSDYKEQRKDGETDN